MKNYIVSNYQDWAILSADLTVELNDLLTLPIKVEHTKFGVGEINSIKVSISDHLFHIITEIDFESQPSLKAIGINNALNSRCIDIQEPAKSIIVDFIEKGTALQIEVKTVSSDRYKIKQAEEKQALELARQQAKLQARMEKGIQDFTAMAKETRSQSATGEFYYALGWLANNAGSITAAMPDYILSYFESQFGTDYTPTVVDSNKRTVNGNPMQWTLSMKVALPKKAQESVPAVFFDYLNPNKTALTSTSFVWDLVDTYGFQFGKTQDVDKIRESIPTEYLEYFEKGYAE